MAEIKKTDIIEPGIPKEFDDITKSVKELIGELHGLASAGKNLNESISKQAATRKNAESVNKTAVSNAKKLETSTVKLTNLQTSYMKSLTSINKQREKAAKLDKKRMKGIKAEEGSINRLNYENKRLIEMRNKINGSTKKGIEEIRKINKAIDENKRKIAEQSSGFEKQKQNIGNYKSALEGMPGPIGRVNAAFKMLAANPIGAVIMAIVGAFTLLQKAFTRSEKGQDKWNKALKVGGAILDVIMDAIGDLADLLVSAFENPKKAISDLWDFIKGQFINRIAALKKILLAFGDILEGVWELDTDKIKKGAKDMGNAYVDALTGVENSIQKTTDALSSMNEKMKIATARAMALADLEAAINKKKRQELIATAKLEGEIETKRAKIEELKKKDAKSAMAIQKEVNKMSLELVKNKEEIARLEYAAAVQKAQIAKNDKEANDALAEAQANYIDAQNQTAAIQRQNAKQMNTLMAEAKRQINENATFTIKTATAVANSVIADQKRIIESQNTTEEQKLQAAEKIKNEQIKLSNETKDALIKGYEEQYKAGLITLDTFNQMKNSAIQKQIADEKKAIAAGEKAKKKIYDDGVKNYFAAQDKRAAFDKKVADEHLKLIDKTIASELTDAQELYAKKQKALEESFKKGEISTKQYEKGIRKLSEETLQTQIQYLNELLDSFDDDNAAKIEIQKELNKKMEELNKQQLDDAKKTADGVTRVWTESDKKRLEQRAKTVATIGDFGDAAFNLYQAQLDREMAALEKEKNYELELAGDNEEAKKKINEKYAAEEAKLKHDQAVANKAQAAFDIILNTAVAAMMAYAQLGPIGGTAAAIIISALGALELATVLMEPIPQFDKGTEHAPVGGFIAGEKRPEIMEHKGKQFIVNKPTLFGNEFAGAKIISGEETEQILNSGLMQSIRLNRLDSNSTTQSLELMELKAIKRAVTSNRSNIIFDQNGIIEIYGQSRNRLKRIDKYIQ